jgi:hypothetical protein
MPTHKWATNNPTRCGIHNGGLLKMLQWNTKVTAILAVTALLALSANLANFTWHALVNFTW